MSNVTASVVVQGRWHHQWLSDFDFVQNLDGVPWFEAKRPRRWHRCKPQTRGQAGFAGYLERCACGAISREGRHWFDRNSRR